MENIFQKLGIVDPHTLTQIRHSLIEDAQNETGLIVILQEHHYFLEESIAIIIDHSSSIPEKRFHLDRFLSLLWMHGKAEQETLYIYLQQNLEELVRLEGLAGQDEHEMAFQLRDELIVMNYKTQWNDEIAAKSRVLAVLIKNHIDLEESEVFTILKKEFNNFELEQIRIEYLTKCQSYLRH